MRSMLRATVIALVLSSVAGVAHGQGIKIAFVNSQALMPAAPGYTAAEATLLCLAAQLEAAAKKAAIE